MVEIVHSSLLKNANLKLHRRCWQEPPLPFSSPGLLRVGWGTRRPLVSKCLSWRLAHQHQGSLLCMSELLSAKATRAKNKKANVVLNVAEETTN